VTIPNRVFSDTTYPTAAETSEALGPKNWFSDGFLWTEDAIFAWRAAAVFGGLVFLLGVGYWVTVNGSGGLFIPVLAVFFVIGFFGAAFVAYMGRTEVAVALLGTAGVAMIMLFLIPSPYAYSNLGNTIPNPSAVVPMACAIVSLWTVGLGLLAVGTCEAFQISRDIDSED